MQLRHIVVATDESDAGRQAVRTGLDLSARSSARLTVMRVVTVRAVPLLGAVAVCADAAAQEDGAAELERLQGWLEPELPCRWPGVPRRGSRRLRRPRRRDLSVRRSAGHRSADPGPEAPLPGRPPAPWRHLRHGPPPHPGALPVRAAGHPTDHRAAGRRRPLAAGLAGVRRLPRFRGRNRGSHPHDDHRGSPHRRDRTGDPGEGRRLRPGCPRLRIRARTRTGP